MTPSRRILLVLLLAIVASAAVSLLVSRRVLAPAAAREEAFAAITHGELQPDASGTVILPTRWRKASVDGNAYVTGERERTLWVLFVTEKGVGAQLTGDLFSTKPAAAQVTSAVVVNYPNPDGPRAEVTIKRVLNPLSFEVVNQRK